MDFDYCSTFGGSSPEAYERLLLDVMVGDATLFMRRDSVEDVVAVGHADSRPLGRAADAAPALYAAGTWGPAEADRLDRGRRDARGDRV